MFIFCVFLHISNIFHFKSMEWIPYRVYFLSCSNFPSAFYCNAKWKQFYFYRNGKAKTAIRLWLKWLKTLLNLSFLSTTHWGHSALIRLSKPVSDWGDTLRSLPSSRRILVIRNSLEKKAWLCYQVRLRPVLSNQGQFFSVTVGRAALLLGKKKQTTKPPTIFSALSVTNQIFWKQLKEHWKLPGKSI